jgi:hypothetical protein
MVNLSDALRLTPDTATSLAGSRILVVLDEVNRDDTLVRLSSVPGTEICPVRSVAEAVECYEDFSPDVVVAEFAHRASLLANGFEAILGKPVRAITLTG